MTNSTHPNQTESKPFTGVKALRSNQSVVDEADYQTLREHLQDHEGDLHTCSPLLASVLRQKLLSTKPTANLHCADFVTSGCRVTYVVEGAAAQTGLLVQTARAGMVGGVIPVGSL